MAVYKFSGAVAEMLLGSAPIAFCDGLNGMGTFDLKDLRFFLETAEAGGITRAAKRLNTTQSALSRRLHNLENDLGVRVFVREANGVRLTEAGRHLQRLGGPLIDQANRVWDAVASNKSSDARQINIGMVAGVSKTVQSAMKRFNRENPNARFNLKEGSSEHLQSLVDSNDLDLALTTNPRAAKGLEITPLWREALYIAAPRSHARGKKIKLSSLNDLPFILATRSPGLRETLKAAFEREGVQFKVAFEIESISTIQRMIAEGEAFSVLAYPTIGNETKALDISLHRMADVYVTRALVRKNRSFRSPNLRAFMRALQLEAADLIESNEWAFSAN